MRQRERSPIALHPTRQPDDALLAILALGPDMPTLAQLRRPAIEDAIALLIDALDALDPDPDLEPTMGRRETGSGQQAPEAASVVDECEDVGDDEPSLGSLGGCSGAAVATQTQWAGGSRQDLEQDVHDEPHDEIEQDREPDCGSLEGLDDQRSWASFARDDEPSLGAPENHHDQRRWAQGNKGSRELDHDERGGLGPFGWQQLGAIERTRRDAEAMLRRKGLLPPRAPDGLPIDPFKLGLVR